MAILRKHLASAKCGVAATAFCWCFSVAVSPALAGGRQQTDAGSNLRARLAAAFEAHINGKTDAAKREFDAVAQEAIASHDRWAEAESSRGRGIIHVDRAEYPAARRQLEAALVLFESLADRLGAARVKRHLGSVDLMTGDRQAAIANYKASIADAASIGAKDDQVRALGALAFALDDDDFDRTAESAIVLAREVGLKDVEGRTLHLIGDRAFSRGDFQSALGHYRNAAAILEAAAKRGDLARVYTSMGRLHRAHGRPADALDFYRRGLQIQEQIGDEQGAIQSINAIAVAHGYLAQHKEALEQYERALERARATGSKRIIAFQLGNLGGAYLDLGNYARGAELLRETLALEQDGNITAYRHTALSIAYRHLGDDSRALEHGELAVATARARNMLEYLPWPLQQRALARRQAGRVDDALADGRAAIAAIEDLRAKLVSTDFLKRGFADWHQRAFALVIDLLHQTNRSAEAFEVAEQARGRAFLDLLATRDVKLKTTDGQATITVASAQPSSPPPVETTVSVSALSTRGSLDASGAEAPRPSATSAGSSRSEPDLDSFVAASPYSSREMAETAKRLRSTVITYWVGETATLIWVVAPDGRIAAARSTISAKNLERTIAETWSIQTGAATRGESQTLPAVQTPSRESWRALYRVLIEPVLASLPTARGERLTIVPHGPLFRLSFAALMSERGEYLAERYVLHYAPAGAVLGFTARRQERLAGRPPRYLFVADPSPIPRETTGPVPALPGATGEVREIARTLPADHVTVLTRERATEPAVRAALRDKSIVHFATHAFIRDTEPLDSYLALGAKGAEPDDDGRLTVREMYGIDVNADLVILGACRTAGGAVSGDGIMGLSRAFFYAGTPSIIATMWDIADEPSRRLVQEFYRQWSRESASPAGGSKAGALRRAQLQVLADLRAGRVIVETGAVRARLPEHPLFWAGFVLLGEP